MGKIKDFLSNIGFDDDRYDENEENDMEENYEDISSGEQTDDAQSSARIQRNARTAPQYENNAQSYRKSGNIETIKPATYSDAHKIIEKLRDGNIIVFSLELVDDDLAIRILDFVYGGTFALSGKIKEVGTRVYVVTNYGVNLSEIAGSNESQKAPSYR